MKVIKRDGTTVDFDAAKIVVAIQKANAAVEPEFRIEEDKIQEIADSVQSRNRMRLLVEDIQDMVNLSWQSSILFTVINVLWCVRPTLPTILFCP